MIQHKIDDYAARDLNYCRFIIPMYSASYKPLKAFQELLYLELSLQYDREETRGERREGRIEDCLNTVFMNEHLVTDINCNSVNLHPPNSSKVLTNNVGLISSLGDTIPRSTITIEPKKEEELVTVIFIYTVATTLNMIFTFTNFNCLGHDARYYKASKDILKRHG